MTNNPVKINRKPAVPATAPPITAADPKAC